MSAKNGRLSVSVREISAQSLRHFLNTDYFDAMTSMMTIDVTTVMRCDVCVYESINPIQIKFY